MATQPERDARLAFGPFELDGSTHLLKSGHRVRLAGQPLQILAALLARPGELVSREELYESIWGRETFVDFDHGLSAAVHKIRFALRDSAESPRYIETVPGRGYRFIAVVERRFPADAVPAMVTGAESEGEQKKIETGKRKHLWLIAAAAATLLTLLFVTYREFKPSPKITAKDTLVIADFANSTGDPVFDGALRQGLELQLQQSPILSVIPDERIERTMSLMGQPMRAPVTGQLAFQICQRTGSAAVLQGSIAGLGSQYVLGLQARSCRNGEIFAEEQAQAQRKEDVLASLSQIAGRFRTRLGESLSTVKEHNTPLAEASTPSLDALKAFSFSESAAMTTGSAAAIPFLQRAVELDPKFALAYAYMGRVYGDLGETVASAESTSKAYELRDHSSDEEKFLITFTYQAQVTGNLEKAEETGELWEQTYPRDIAAYGPISGVVYQALGEYDKSIRAAETSVGIDPFFTFGYVNRGYAELFTDDLPGVARTLERAASEHLEIPDLLLLRYLLGLLQGNPAEMDRAMASARGKAGGEDWLLQAQAMVSARAGQLKRAEGVSLQAADLATQIGHTERSAIYRAGGALWYAFYGNQSEAKEAANGALKLSKGRDVEFGAAFALALAGELSGAQAIAGDLERRFPEDTFVRFTYSPSLRALVALQRGEARKAIQLVDAALPYEKGVPGSEFIGLFGSLYPAYVRGRAYQMEGRPSDAAREFQKIVDHRGLVSCDPIDAMARLALARSLISAGEIEKGKSSYRNLFVLWSGADGNVPVLRQAKEEYRRLK